MAFEKPQNMAAFIAKGSFASNFDKCYTSPVRYRDRLERGTICSSALIASVLQTGCGTAPKENEKGRE